MRLFLYSILLAVIGCSSRDPAELDRLIKALRSADSSERNMAALAIAEFGAEGKKAVPALTYLLNHDASRGIRTSAAYALRKIGTKEAIAALDKYKE